MSGRELPQDATGDALRRLLRDGSDLTRPMSVDFHVAVPSQWAGQLVGAAASVLGFSSKVYYDEEEDDWTCECTKDMIPSYEAITESEILLDPLAQQYGGYVDGWGSFGNAKESP